MTPTTLNQYADALLETTEFELSPEQVHITRCVNPVLNIMSTQVVANTEPHDIMLPLHVVWLCMDRSTPFYRVLMVRDSKDPSQGFNHTWRPIETLNQIWIPQFYDSTDSGADANFDHATTLVDGIARLTKEPESDAYPRFVSVSDPRNSDAREPLPHTHPEKPAVRLKHKTGSISIDATAPLSGQTLRALNALDAEYATVKATDIRESS